MSRPSSLYTQSEGLLSVLGVNIFDYQPKDNHYYTGGGWGHILGGHTNTSLIITATLDRSLHINNIVAEAN